jgi:hypothetical protein
MMDREVARQPNDLARPDYEVLPILARRNAVWLNSFSKIVDKFATEASQFNNGRHVCWVAAPEVEITGLPSACETE